MCARTSLLSAIVASSLNHVLLASTFCYVNIIADCYSRKYYEAAGLAQSLGHMAWVPCLSIQDARCVCVCGMCKAKCSDASGAEGLVQQLHRPPHFGVIASETSHLNPRNRSLRVNKINCFSSSTVKLRPHANHTMAKGSLFQGLG